MVDLGEGSANEIKLDKELYRDYLGRSGLAAKWFFDNRCREADPLSPENPLMIMMSLFQEAIYPGGARLEFCVPGVLRQVFPDRHMGEACMGAPQMRGTRYDGRG
ncbi:MAG: hypothetical protein JXA49_08820 [Actinobacteria bacterium]|nr:hypothetical protein [Actinomycetota bacterium]